MSEKAPTGDSLRRMLFKQLEQLTDPTKDVDLKRAEVTNATAQAIINSAKVEVEYVKAIGGSIILPFIENQDGVEERPHTPPPTPAPVPPPAPIEDAKPKTPKNPLTAGPSPDHPWNGWNGLGQRPAGN